MGMKNTIMEEQRKQMKAMLLEMLEWFHGICQTHGLRYYILGGTMLGAARHQGFIPWDDDIDLGMPRADYLRLRQVMETLSQDRYLLETPDSERSDYVYPGSKLYDTRTTLVEHNRYRIKRGIFLDIFPLDGIGDTREEAMKRFAPIRRKRNLLLTFTTGIRQGRRGWKNLAVLLMRSVPDWAVSKKKLLRSLDRICASRDFNCCRWGGNLVGSWMERELMPRSFWGEPTLYRFETLWVYGPERYDAYLTALYGDWRQLPPVERRVSHHDFLLLDLNRSWRDA